MIDGRPVFFARDRRFLLDEGTFSPFNSQATLWTPEVFPLLFFPLGVSDRVTDILRSYIATVCLWKAGYFVAFASPIVYQNRNLQNLHNDFKQEMHLYLNADAWCQSLLEIEVGGVAESYRSAIKMLMEQGAIADKCQDIYEKFLSAAGLV